MENTRPSKHRSIHGCHMQTLLGTLYQRGCDMQTASEICLSFGKKKYWVYTGVVKCSAVKDGLWVRCFVHKYIEDQQVSASMFLKNIY